MIATSGTFKYSITIPEGGRAALPWVAQPTEPLKGDDQRLVGHNPSVQLTDFDERYGVARTRITLTTQDRAQAIAGAFSLVVNRNFAGMLKPRDVLNVVRTHMCCLGLSLLRDDVLVAAAGAASAVPLGDGVTVQYPDDLAREVNRVYQTRDPRYRMGEVPIQITVDGVTRLLHGGRVTLGRYEVFVVHGFEPADRECIALSLVGVCADCAATLTAPLLERNDLLQMAL